jgi:hypothetical protein
LQIPKQGLRHAATLLLRQRCQAIAADAGSEDVAGALEQLARDLVALAGDMHAGPESSEWLFAEYASTIDRLAHGFDRDAARTRAREIFEEIAARESNVEPRDLFLVFVPEDRLSIAAPLAIELVKRRLSVAFSEYEVSTAGELEWAIQHGLTHHRAGAVLWTNALQRATWHVHLPETDRLRVIHECHNPETGIDLAAWAHRLKVQNNAK